MVYRRAVSFLCVWAMSWATFLANGLCDETAAKKKGADIGSTILEVLQIVKPEIGALAKIIFGNRPPKQDRVCFASEDKLKEAIQVALDKSNGAREIQLREALKPLERVSKEMGAISRLTRFVPYALLPVQAAAAILDLPGDRTERDWIAIRTHWDAARKALEQIQKASEGAYDAIRNEGIKQALQNLNSAFLGLTSYLESAVKAGDKEKALLLSQKLLEILRLANDASVIELEELVADVSAIKPEGTGIKLEGRSVSKIGLGWIKSVEMNALGLESFKSKLLGMR